MAASTAQQFRKKPVVIEAAQLGHDYDVDCEIVAWCGGRAVGSADGIEDAVLAIDTPEGTMYASHGDYVIKGVEGEFYPCKPSIFEATYESVGDEDRPPFAIGSRVRVKDTIGWNDRLRGALGTVVGHVKVGPVWQAVVDADDHFGFSYIYVSAQDGEAVVA